jgi:phage gp29-like protein
MMIPKQAQFQMMDGKTSNGDGGLQERLIQACNREMSIAILGNTETTSSSSSSGYAQAEIHAGQQNQLTQADLRYVLSYLNSPFFHGILAQYGYPVEGGKFMFEQAKDVAALQQKLQIDLQVATKVPIDDDYWYDTYGIPRPDNSQRAADETPSDENDDEKDDKKSLFDRARSFFV